MCMSVNRIFRKCLIRFGPETRKRQVIIMHSHDAVYPGYYRSTWVMFTFQQGQWNVKVGEQQGIVYTHTHTWCRIVINMTYIICQMVSLSTGFYTLTAFYFCYKLFEVCVWVCLGDKSTLTWRCVWDKVSLIRCKTCALDRDITCHWTITWLVVWLSCATSDPVSAGMGDRLWAGIPSLYVTS